MLQMDEKRSAAMREFETLRAQQNKASGEIARLKDPAEKKAAVARMQSLKQQVQAAQEQSREAESRLEPLLLSIPQPPDDDVPVGKDAADNLVMYRWGEPRQFAFTPRSHAELAQKHQLIDSDRGVRLAGSRSYFLVGKGRSCTTRCCAWQWI